MLTMRSVLCVIWIGLSQSLFASEYSATILHPAGYTASVAVGVDGVTQVGAGNVGTPLHPITKSLIWKSGTATPFTPAGFDQLSLSSVSVDAVVGSATGIATNNAQHAAVWLQPGMNFVDLHPNGFSTSVIRSTTGNAHGGSGIATSDVQGHAIFWSNSSGTFADLHPVGFKASDVYSVTSAFQVGEARTFDVDSVSHATMWYGSSGSFVDLHPAGLRSSTGFGAGGNQQVGAGFKIGDAGSHALLWTGSAGSVVDLNPLGYVSSLARDTNGALQVGNAALESSPLLPHAMVWYGDGSHFFDLHTLLPVNFDSSYAWDIDEYGNIVGYAVTTDGISQAVIWTVPEPACWSVMATTLLALLSLRRRRIQ